MSSSKKHLERKREPLSSVLAERIAEARATIRVARAAGEKTGWVSVDILARIERELGEEL